MIGFVKDKLINLLALSIFEVQKGLVEGVIIINKSGRNSSITSVSAPEDIWNGSAVYSGFPTGAPEILSFVSSSALDLGVLKYEYLATATSTVWQTATVTLNGIIPVLGVSAYRVHIASYNSGTSTGFNAGTITCNHSVTVANIFFVMATGTNQTYAAVYTVPFGSTGFIKKSFCTISSDTGVSMQGAFWVRESGASPRLIRNLNVSNNIGYTDDELYLKLPSMTDISLRITSSSSASAQTVLGGFDLVLINQIL